MMCENVNTCTYVYVYVYVWWACVWVCVYQCGICIVASAYVHVCVRVQAVDGVGHFGPLQQPRHIARLIAERFDLVGSVATSRL
jgi:hypothetical protein